MENLVVDFMPLEEKVLGFNNRWYIEGFKNSVEVSLDERNTIRIFTALYFLAAKIEAFKSRGKNKQGGYDGRFSTDFEDIVFVLVNRNAIWQEMDEAEGAIKEYLRVEFTSLLDNPDFEEWLDAHTDFSSPATQAIILPRIKKFVTDSPTSHNSPPPTPPSPSHPRP